ncbi:DUF4386 domain-containing protein [Nocardia noduli]|uniref:DUF4386 domain-containing protein n=1 Tax=Nocardia noduli TaxID=2815722 RepID=UPI001C225045|nr:DUF4386 domain-containing protein [Nocardia noduli]
MSPRPFPTIALLIAAPLTLDLAFIGLGAVFDYPDVLGEPGFTVLATFRANQTAIVTWFCVLATAALTLAPLAVLIGRLERSASMRAAVGLGIAASLVQAVGLLRWPLLAPGLADRAAAEGPDSPAVQTFETLGMVLGTALGETLGYTLTATWTVCVAFALRGSLPRWFTAWALASAALIATGVLAPLDNPLPGLANFLGYILWSGWLLTFAVLLALGRHRQGQVANREVRIDARGARRLDNPPRKRAVVSAMNTTKLRILRALCVVEV